MESFVSSRRLKSFLNEIRAIFAPMTHTHKLSDIKDYTVDTTLSSTSNNPISNKTVKTEFDKLSDSKTQIKIISWGDDD